MCPRTVAGGGVRPRFGPAPDHTATPRSCKRATMALDATGCWRLVRRMFDPIALAYYAAVCAALGILAPRVPRWPARLIVGAGVGVVAAGALPAVRTVLGL